MTTDNLKHTSTPPQNSVTLFHWDESESTSFGHVAIEIVHNREKFYVSFSPDESFDFTFTWNILKENVEALFESQGALLDATELEKYTHESIRLENLNTEKMLQAFVELTGFRSNHISPNLKWGIGKHNHTCASLVVQLLKAGGGWDLLPNYGRFGHPLHIILLSFRTSLLIAAISPIYYYIITMRDALQFSPSVLLGLSVNIAIISKLEYLLSHTKKHNILNYLFTSRKRRLIEICSTDNTIQIISSLGFALTGLIFREASLSNQNSILLRIIVDVIWFALSSGGFLISGWGASKLLYFINGMDIIIRPSGIKPLGKYLEKTAMIKAPFRELLFSHESSLIFMVLSTVIGFNLAKDFFEATKSSFLIGSLTGLLCGYFFTTCTRLYIDSKLPISNAIVTRETEKVISTHDPMPEKFAFVSGSTIIGIIGSLMIYESITDDPITFVASSISVLGGVTGYLAGTVLFNGLKETIEYSCTSITKWCCGERFKFFPKKPTPEEVRNDLRKISSLQV